MRFRATTFALTLPLLSACQGGPSCDEVAKHLWSISPPDKQAIFTEPQLIEQCKEEKPSKKELVCILEAKTFEAAAACDPRNAMTKKPS